MLGMTVRENFSLTHLSKYCTLDVVNRSRENAACGRFINLLNIKTPSPEQKVLNLSGGNQQKVVIAKWVARRPRILIVDEPTRGIDIGAKAEVHALLNELARDGLLSCADGAQARGRSGLPWRRGGCVAVQGLRPWLHGADPAVHRAHRGPRAVLRGRIPGSAV